MLLRSDLHGPSNYIAFGKLLSKLVLVITIDDIPCTSIMVTSRGESVLYNGFQLFFDIPDILLKVNVNSRILPYFIKCMFKKDLNLIKQ